MGALGLVLLALLFLTSRDVQDAWFGSAPLLRELQEPLGWNHPGSYGVVCSALTYVTLVCEGRAIHWLMSCSPPRWR